MRTNTTGELGEGVLSVDHDGWMPAKARWEHTVVG
jgi:hypothetical protein